MKKNDSRLTETTNFYNAARITSNFALLAQAGFTVIALGEGGALIAYAVKLVRLSEFPKGTNSDLLGAINVYQSRWFPTTRAVLERHHPDLGEVFFANMVQLDEKRSPISVLEFLETLGRLGRGEPPFGERGPQARALLSERMLTAEVEAEGQALIAEWNGLADDDDTGVIVTKEEVEAAISAAWKWRVEWAEHARTVIKSRGLLRGLSIRQKKTRKARAEATTPALPAHSVAPAAPALTAGSEGSAPAIVMEISNAT